MKPSERTRRLIPNLYRYPERDNNSHSISPISQNDCQAKGRPSEGHFKTCASNERSRNVTPTNLNFYSVQTLNTNRNSVLECSNCSDLEKKLRISNQNLQKLKEKQISSAKHLNQYESLLKIKENRINEKEKSLNEQILALENEKIALLEKSSSFAESEQKSRFTCASNSQILQKNQEFTACWAKVQESFKRNQATMTEITENINENRVFECFKEMFKVKEENIVFKEAEIERNKQILIKESQENQKIHEKNLKMKEKNFLERQEIEKQWKTLKDETILLDEKKKQLELESLALDRSRVSLENETKMIRESFEAKHKELESWKVLSESRISTEQINKASPEKISEFNIETFDELSFGKNAFSESGKFSEVNSLPGSVKESSLNQKIFTPQELIFFEQENPNKSTYISRDSREENMRLGIIEQIRARFDQKSLEFQHQLKLKELFFTQETEKFQNQIQELESLVELFKDQNSKLQELNQKLKNKLKTLKKDLKEIKKVKGFDQLEEIIEKVQEKLKNLKEKEEEIWEFRRHLNCEQETLMNEAECLKILYQEMNKEKIGFCEQKEELFIQKKALMEIEKMHKEKVELLDIKEKELAKFKDELVSKEINLRRTFTRNVRIPKRVNTHLGELSEDCLIFK